MAQTASKGAAIAVAVALIPWGIQQALVGGDVVAGVIAIAIGALVAVGYQYVEDTDHERPYNELVATIGEDNLRELSEMGADELRRMRENLADQE